MIESRLDPLVDGVAGDYGGYPGLTVAETARRFRTLAAEHRPSSVSGILRIAREQAKGRRSLTSLLSGSALFGLSCLLLALCAACSPDPFVRRNTGSLALALFVFAGPIVVGTFHNRERIAHGYAQLGELRRLALEALHTIVSSPWFVPKALGEEERRTLRTLRKAGCEVWDRVAWILTEGE